MLRTKGGGDSLKDERAVEHASVTAHLKVLWSVVLCDSGERRKHALRRETRLAAAYLTKQVVLQSAIALGGREQGRSF